MPWMSREPLSRTVSRVKVFSLNKDYGLRYFDRVYDLLITMLPQRYANFYYNKQLLSQNNANYSLFGSIMTQNAVIACNEGRKSNWNWKVFLCRWSAEAIRRRSSSLRPALRTGRGFQRCWAVCLQRRLPTIAWAWCRGWKFRRGSFRCRLQRSLFSWQKHTFRQALLPMSTARASSTSRVCTSV